MFKKPSLKSPPSTLFLTPFQQPKRRASDDLTISNFFINNNNTFFLDNTRIPAPTSSQSSSRQNLFESGNFSRSASRCSSLAGLDISEILQFSRIPALRSVSKSSTSSCNTSKNSDKLSPLRNSPSL